MKKVFYIISALIILTALAACSKIPDAIIVEDSYDYYTYPVKMPENVSENGIPDTIEILANAEDMVMVSCEINGNPEITQKNTSNLKFNMLRVPIKVNEIIFANEELLETEFNINMNMDYVYSTEPFANGTKFVIVFSMYNDDLEAMGVTTPQRMLYLTDQMTVIPVSEESPFDDCINISYNDLKNIVLESRNQQAYFNTANQAELPVMTAGTLGITGTDGVIFDGVVQGLKNQFLHRYNRAYIPYIGIYGSYEENEMTTYLCDVKYIAFYDYIPNSNYAGNGSVHPILAAVSVKTNEGGDTECVGFEYVNMLNTTDDDITIFCGSFDNISGILAGNAEARAITPNLSELVRTYAALPENEIKYIDSADTSVEWLIDRLERSEYASGTAYSGSEFEPVIENYLKYMSNGQISVTTCKNKTSLYIWNSSILNDDSISEYVYVLADVDVTLQTPEDTAFKTNGRHTMRACLFKEKGDDNWYIDKFSVIID